MLGAGCWVLGVGHYVWTFGVCLCLWTKNHVIRNSHHSAQLLIIVFLKKKEKKEKFWKMKMVE